MRDERDEIPENLSAELQRLLDGIDDPLPTMDVEIGWQEFREVLRRQDLLRSEAVN